METPEGLFQEHVIRGFMLSGGRDAPVMSLTDYAADVSEEASGCDLGDLTTREIWPMPSALLGFPGGGLMLRRTRMPAPEGREVFSLLVVAVSRLGYVAHGHMYELEGRCSTPSELLDDRRLSPFRAEFRLRSPRPCPAAEKLGSSFQCLLREPLWGFGPEPVGFVSTLDLASIDEAMELERLMAVASPTKEQAHRIESLKRTPGGSAVMSTMSDPGYVEFKKLFIERMGLPDWGGVRTKREIAAQNAAADEIFREVFPEADDGPAMRP